MDKELARRIGERVRFYRVAAGKTQPVTAGLAGITVDYLYQIERGTKLPTISVLADLANVLKQPVDALLHHVPTPPRRTAEATGDELHRALTFPVTETCTTSPDEVNAAIAVAWHEWQTSPHRYSQLTRTLPRLVTMVEGALAAHCSPSEAASRQQVHRHAADLYALVRTVAKRLGRADLSLLAADRAIRAAEVADDSSRLAVARWNLAQVLLASGELAGAEALAMHGIEELANTTADDSADVLALRGSLLLVAAIAAARRGDRWVARDRLHLAEFLARRTGERNTLWTAFGPTNVRMFAVSVEVETGDGAEGLCLAEQIDHDRSPSIERRVALLLDQAKGYEQRRDFMGALVMLAAAERQAPEDVRHRPAAHAVLRQLVQRGRRTLAGEAARIAVRAGVPL
ncbi:transcriptional regulator with XRE-family HTH domain [Saccharothrix coeruleofusca]|uniref:helix-turn-helix domain-containing protein n=1 Tax=Saccharothrix coeruleofusca TaxID=33919 RepID=UPI001AE6C87F|nr:helix-turn-helix transcriptional regulator [Saccharothrix coeruleofusca]MBP2336075.1 transcriptional regulator with XRE-family HTH domain [Saccharothrix coeruleofusca]